MPISIKKPTKADSIGFEPLLIEARKLGYEVFQPRPNRARGGLGFYQEGESKGFAGPNFMLNEEGTNKYKLHFFNFHRLGIEEFEGDEEVIKTKLKDAKDWFEKNPPPD